MSCSKESNFFAGRVFVDILTLGLGEISRATAGNTNHWAFVAKAETLDNQVSLLTDHSHPLYTLLYFRATRFISWHSLGTVT